MQIAILGSGTIGATLARRLTEAGHEVTLANSRGAASLEPLVAELGPRAHAAPDIAAAADGAEVAVLALPFFLYDQLPSGALAGKVVIDPMNYYPGRDGELPQLADDSTTSSELLARHLPGARVVKAFNTMVSTKLGADGRPAGDPERLVIFVAGDDGEAKAVVRALADDIGFDTVDHGGLAAGRAQQPGSAVYGVPFTLAQAAAT
ncbi:MAG: NAD(P)-binding domain-containing protein [Actinomycetota bacterium]|nr:NAD(P)-binding domain-containing protein [Actinomycetota bacterium]